MRRQAQKPQQGAGPQDGQGLHLHLHLPAGHGDVGKGPTDGAGLRVPAAGAGPPQHRAAPAVQALQAPPSQPCKLPGQDSAHTSVEGELFARYTVSVRRVSYESVFKYVTGSINRDLL